nr:NTP transferase domain-containing protein [Cohnella sp. REN36]
MAAGEGKRMNGVKLAAELLPGLPLGAVALRALLSVGLDAVYVVVRPGEAPEWLRQEVFAYPGDLNRKSEPERESGSEASPPLSRGAVQGTDRRTELTMLVCEDAELGMAYSLRRGIGEAAAAGCGAAVVLLADQPFVTAAMVRALIGCWRSDPRLDYVASGNGDVMTPPVLLAAKTFPHVARLEGDIGAKRLLERSDFAGRVLSANEPERLADVDTPALLEEARQFARQKRVTLCDI